MDEFINAIKTIKVAESVSGIVYSNIHVTKDRIIGVRESTNAKFEIPLKNLYDAYCELTAFNTSLLKPYVDRVQSPALAILLACNAIEKYDDNASTSVSGHERETSSSVRSNRGKSSWMKKFFTTFLIAGAFIVLGTLYSEDTTSNGRQTGASHEKAVIAIKSQMRNPASYEGGSWEDAVWDSKSVTKRYVLKHNFTQKNSWGERVKSVAFIYFDVDGQPTDIEIMQ